MTSSIPSRAEFEAFYERWFPRTVALAHRKGLADPEAAAQEVLSDFVVKDYLDPKGRWSRWHDDRVESWYGSIIHRRLTSLVRKELRRRDIAPQVALADRHLDVGPVDVFSAFGELKDLVRGVHRKLDRERPDLVPIWVGVVRHFLFGDMRNGSVVSYKDLAEEMGISRSEATGQLAELRVWLAGDGAGLTGELIDRALASA